MLPQHKEYHDNMLAQFDPDGNIFFLLLLKIKNQNTHYTGIIADVSVSFAMVDEAHREYL